MKNLKKVLAMVLAFACTFSMFAGAKVFEDVPAGSDYSEAVTMLSDLGIIQGKDDGKYHPEDTITRAEACAMIARLMTGDPNVSQYVGAQSFTDVAKGSWKDSAIGYCYINGIVIGVGDNKFEPDRAITDAEFITMVVRAMGYETADMKQNYPYSYMSNAQAIGLLDGTNMVASTDALRGEDAQVIYNALFTDYARGAKLVNTTHGTSVESYPTLAESVWGLTRAAAGEWDKNDDETATLEYCKAHTWVVLGADPNKDGHILAYPISDDDGDLYAMDKSVETVSFKYAGDASAVAGYQVELWGEGSHGEPEWQNKNDTYAYSEDWEIKAIKTVKGQTAYDYNASLKDSKPENGTIELGEDSLDLDAVAGNAQNASVYAVDQYVSNEYNGEKINKAEDVETALNVRDGAQYKLMDWDSDGDIDWVVVSSANYYKVESVSSKRLTVSYMQDKDPTNEEDNTTSKTLTWKLDDTNEEDGYDLDIKGAEDLAEGDIIEVTYTVSTDDDKQLVTGTISKVEAETLTLDKVSTKNNMILTFDGETMELAQNEDVGDTIVPANPSKYAGFDEEELGTEFNVWTDRNGFIVYSDYATESTNYMLVLDTADGSDKTGDRKQAVIDFVSADNKLHKDVELTASARILEDDGRTETGAYNDNDRTFDESKIVGNVYKYWTNEDGEITKMQEVVNGGVTADDYDYVAKNDRLTLDNESYALEDAKAIFAVIGDYIKAEKDSKEGDVDLYVNSGDVLAVKQSDIPDIGEKDSDDDTVAAVLDAESTTAATKSWVNDADVTVALSADKNKDISAAVLGVDSFNKFNAGATKVGLVTNVSYDSKDVVSIDVAYNGKVETISSAEKVDFDDIVSVMDYTAKNNTKEYSVGSRTEDIKNGIMTGTNLKDYLNKSAAYAEVTVDADGKLTGVMFMDKKSDEDGTGNDNVVIGNYYQVSRKVIADVNEGKWISTVNDDVYYGGSDSKLTSIDTKNSQTVASDFADEVFYYTIDGGATRVDDTYTADKALAILGDVDKNNTQKTNFDGNPDIAVAEASDLETSDIYNESDSANDTYYVADIASKIADDGKGDVTAVYMFEDEMDEADGVTTDAVAELKLDGNLTDTVSYKGNVAVEDVAVVDANGKTAEGVTAKLDADKNEVTITVDAATAKAGKYTLQLKDRKGNVVGKTEFEVKASDVATVDSDAKVVNEGVVSAPEQMAQAEVTFEGTPVQTKGCAIYVNGQKIEYQTTSTTLNTEVEGLENAINDALIVGITAEADDAKLTVKSSKANLEVEVEFVAGSTDMSVASNEVTAYKAAVAEQKGKATLTINAGINTADKNFKLTVDGAKVGNNVTVTKDMTAAEIATAIAEACSSDGTYTVSAQDNVVTVEQKTAAAAPMVVDFVEA